jgi:hypothetical protein
MAFDLSRDTISRNTSCTLEKDKWMEFDVEALEITILHTNQRISFLLLHNNFPQNLAASDSIKYL